MSAENLGNGRVTKDGASGNGAPLGTGEMAERIRLLDWSKTPIGPAKSWSPTLRMTVRQMLANPFPMLLWWGPQYVSIYNDAYRPILGAKHPWALSQPVSECWKEIWHILRPLIDRPFSGGPATWAEDILLEIRRHGFLEEGHFTVSYSPIPDDLAAGGIGGVLATVQEITGKVVGERRMTAMRDLGTRVAHAKTAEEACGNAVRTLAAYEKDLPFVLLYLIEADGKSATLAGAAGVDSGSPIGPRVLNLDDDRQNCWPVTKAIESGELQLVERLGERFSVPPGPWSDPTDSAAIAAVPSNRSDRSAALLIAGLSPRLKFDDSYRDFLRLVTAQIAAAIGNARAYEEERKRSEALAEIDRAKTTFFSNVSHEFRTPLTLMLGPIEDALADPDTPSNIRGNLDVAHRNSLRLLKLVNTLLDFSRIEAGRVQASFQETDLGAFTAEIASVFRSAIERAGMTLDVRCDSLGQPVYVDREMWEKIVLNLLSNAFKYTLQGTISVRLKQVDDSAELSVQDTGVGIPKEEIPLLFHRFHRVKGTHGRTHEGTGIGLALVQELVKLHGGTIGVESAHGKGSSFVVTLPLGKEHLPDAGLKGETTLNSTSIGAQAFVEEATRWLPDDSRGDEQVVGTLPAEGHRNSPHFSLTRGARIVVAEDNADMREYLVRLLRPHWSVVAVADGVGALEQARLQKPDLILSDVMMPRLDGFGLVQTVRSDDRLKEIPIILLSARAGEEARVEGMEVGADDYLVKPFAARELLARVGAALALTKVREQAAESLRASEERCRAFIAASSDVVYSMSPDWSEMRNLQGRQFVSDTTKPTVGWLEKYIHPDDQDMVMAAIRQAIKTRSVFELEHRVIRADGTLGWTFSRAIPIFNDAGEILEWFGAATDITQRKLLLDSERNARKEAETASRLKDEFLANLSHELRTPLNAIVGWSHLIEQGKADPATVAEGVSVISRNARVQTQLIEDLLDLSRIISGKLRLDVKPLSLSDVVTAAIETITPSAQAKNIRVEKVLDSRAGPVSGDPSRLQQVVWNLLSNSVKFTPKGGKIQVVVKRINSHVDLTVSDTGQGIDQEFLPFLFERFRQADASTSRRQSGLGIGLSLVKQIVELHGGMVRAQSAGEGQGATFTVTLPLSIAWHPQESQRPEPAARQHGNLDGQLALDGVRVLYVDDDPDARTMGKRILSEVRAYVILAASASEAIDLVRTERPDVLVSDIGMPEMDGYELIRRVRELGVGEGGATPAAALTAFARSEDRQRALLAGYQSHVAKPVEPRELLTVVASLSGKVPRRAPRSAE